MKYLCLKISDSKNEAQTYSFNVIRSDEEWVYNKLRVLSYYNL